MRMPVCRDISTSFASSARPHSSASENPLVRITAKPQPFSPACSTALTTPAAGITTITTSTGPGSEATSGTPCRPITVSCFGFTG